MHDMQGVGEACKLILPSLLLRWRGPNNFFFLVVTRQGYKSWRSPLRTPTSFHTIYHPLLTSFPMTEKERGMERRQRERGKGNRRKTRILEVLLPLPSRTMVEQGWTPSTITPGHLQKLVKQGSVAAAELATCRISEDPESFAPAGGYIMLCTTFYERGFGVRSQ
jgi:hypothetical protein